MKPCLLVCVVCWMVISIVTSSFSWLHLSIRWVLNSEQQNWLFLQISVTEFVALVFGLRSLSLGLGTPESWSWSWDPWVLVLVLVRVLEPLSLGLGLGQGLGTPESWSWSWSGSWNPWVQLPFKLEKFLVLGPLSLGLGLGLGLEQMGLDNKSALHCTYFIDCTVKSSYTGYWNK